MEIISAQRGRTVKTALVSLSGMETDDEIESFVLDYFREDRSSIYGLTLYRYDDVTAKVQLWID